MNDGPVLLVLGGASGSKRLTVDLDRFVSLGSREEHRALVVAS
jgi:hypothetical protein